MTSSLNSQINLAAVYPVCTYGFVCLFPFFVIVVTLVIKSYLIFMRNWLAKNAFMAFTVVNKVRGCFADRPFSIYKILTWLRGLGE